MTDSVDRNVVWHRATVDRAAREAVLGQRGCLVWFTGLSGSGKSTVANLLEARLADAGIASYLLDGDNVRHGLCKDLGFTPEHRRENIRRLAEVGKLFVDAGLITLTAFISPYRSERSFARSLLQPGDFFEVYVSTPIEVCEERDPTGLYQKARDGKIPEFTGISAPYEVPLRPEVVFDTSRLSLDQCVDRVWEALKRGGHLGDHRPSGGQGAAKTSDR
jgi:adenylylsulfate kinase